MLSFSEKLTASYRELSFSIEEKIGGHDKCHISQNMAYQFYIFGGKYNPPSQHSNICSILYISGETSPLGGRGGHTP